MAITTYGTVIYGSDGENGFGTIYGVGRTYDEAHAEAVRNLCGMEEGKDVDFFCVDCSEAVYEALTKDGGNDIKDTRFSMVGDYGLEVLVTKEEEGGR